MGLNGHFIKTLFARQFQIGESAILLAVGEFGKILQNSTTRLPNLSEKSL